MPIVWQRPGRDPGRLSPRLAERETALNEQMAAAASDHAQLVRLQTELGLLVAEREQLETSWLQTSESLEV